MRQAAQGTCPARINRLRELEKQGISAAGVDAPSRTKDVLCEHQQASGAGKTGHFNPNTPWCNAVRKIREKLWQPKYPLVQHSLQNTRKNMATQNPPSASQFAKHEKKCGNPNIPLVQHSLRNTRKTMATQISPSSTQFAKYEKHHGNPNTP